MATISSNSLEQSAPKKALLMLDIQHDFTSEEAKIPMDFLQTTQMINNLNKLLDETDQENVEVIYIGNEFSKFDFLNIFRNFAAIKNTKGATLDSRLKVVSNNYFAKNKQDAFTNPALNTFLQSNDIKELFISGLMAEACVYATIKSAIKIGYKVNVLTDCITTTSIRKKEKTLLKYLQIGAKNIESKDVIK